MLTLFMAPGSSSFAPHIALREVGAEFELRPLSFARKEHQSAAYRAINPEGKVPTLLVEGRPLTEVAGILFYLARRYPAARLMPDGLEDQAQVISWMSFIAATVHPARRQGIDHARGIFGLAEQRLGDARWCVGDTYSIADIHLFRLFWRFRNALKPDDAEFPRLLAHHDRVMLRPAVKQTIAVESDIGYELP